MYNDPEIPEFINIDKLVALKNPALLKWTPRFLLNYIKKTIHQDEVNYVLHTYGNYEGIDFVNAILEQHWQAHYTAYGLADIPADGRYIFVSNHPLGAFDGLMLMSAISKRFCDIKFVVNDLLMHLKPLESLFVPINKHGRQSADYAARISATYTDSKQQVLYFPAGLCSRRIKGVITDLPWKRNFLQKAVQYQRDIVPIYFDGRNSNWFYGLSNFRKRLGIKANIEMFYLPDEFFKQKKAHFNIFFDKPIPYQTFDKSKTPEQWTQIVREKVYAMQPKNV
ncbi:MAG: 1-acyl-sn-glycerol-3-phosphate acyltransferase [Prevotellaceae bacterium]|jgi:putative hemolysin|nr:1-acyl-sn-glycerol-3-phosphate acyltransferase [Prevotellaceae bacterium]